MDAVKEWAVTVCAIIVLSAAVNLIAPHERYQSMLRIVMACVMLCVIITPLMQLKNCASDIGEYVRTPSTANNELSNKLLEQTAGVSRDAMESLICEELEKMEIKGYSVELSMDITEDGCISIGQVVIVVPKNELMRSAEISSRLNSQLGIDAEVTSE